jgi:hypothetical protein
MDYFTLKMAVKNAVKEALNTDDEIFIRLISSSEKNSETLKRRALYSFPEKSGYEVVYKPYGVQGKGFYYVKK